MLAFMFYMGVFGIICVMAGLVYEIVEVFNG